MAVNAERFMEGVSEFHQGFWSSTWTLTKRQMILMKRDPACLQGRAMLVIVVGLLFAILFYQFGLDDTQMTMGVIYASVLSQGLGEVAWIVTFYDARVVFYKQRAANFFRTSSYVVATMLVQLPLAVMETLVFGSLIYWLGGFVYELGAFLMLELLLLLILLVFLSLVFFLAAASPNLSIAEPVAMVCVLFYVLFAGFIVSKNQIPDWLVWLYWLDPVAWTVRSVVVSQYRHPELDVCVYGAFDYCAMYSQTMGEFSLGLFDVPSAKSWVRYGIIFLVLVFLGFTLLTYFVLEYYRFDRPENVALSVDPKARKAKANDPKDDAFSLVASPCASDVDILGIDARTETVLRIDRIDRKKKVEPVTVAFKDLWYTVSAPGGPGQPAQALDLLKGITGYALPGSITALMGSTGAGKTTLMDVIAGRKTGGIIRGQILLNGFEASDLSVRRCTRYCEQTDIHSKASTFREALTFSAFLRQGADVSDSDKFDTVDECLELLDLDEIADRMIRGSSMDKMKRLTIGVEMAAQPSVLFLDEPTSGLDARSAKVIMDGVRKVADSGRTVLCTIHQPSSDVFHLFDSLLLLKKGGETIYFGELGDEASAMVDYFQSIPSVPRLKRGYNPATWMLEVIGAGVAERGEKQPTEDINFVHVFDRSASKVRLDFKLTEPGLFQPSEQYEPVTYGKKRAARNMTQLRLLLHRFFITYWRTPSYNLTRLGISVLLGLVFGLLFSDADYTTYQGINSGLGLIFPSTVFVGLVALISELPLAFEERATFYRERSSQTYNTLWYFVSFTAVEIPNVLVCAMLFTAVYYPMVGFSGFTHAVFYWINVALMILFESYLGQFCIFAAPSIEVASIIGMQINAISFMLMGFNPPANQIPSDCKWLYTVSPHRYSFAALVGTVFGECSDDQLAEIRLATASAATVVSASATSVSSTSARSLASIDMSKHPLGCQMLRHASPEIGAIPIQTYVDQVFGVVHDEKGRSFGIFLGMIGLLSVLALVAMRYSNHQQR
ncbi:ABC transporter G family member 36 [Phytophthora rubi]|uniref:ABC transporter G family member 36 n=3 Tax=Phytophthora TaxID=4783 RepID=A0A6A3N7A4_9STRA|nr:ABC transporter G family member 36 [Phytophthora rubi]